MTQQLLFISFILVGLVQFSFGQKTIAPTKQQLVSNLVKSTGQIFPYQQFEGGFRQTKGIITAEFKNGVGEILSETIDSIKELTPAQKRKLKTQSPQFAQQYANVVDYIIGRNFNIKSWVSESATKHFSQKFSVAELQKINAFLKTPSGQKALVAMRTAFAKGFSFDIREANYVDADKFEKEVEKFLDSPLGTKFFNVLMENIIMDVAFKMDLWKKQVAEDFDTYLNEEEFINLVSEFISRSLEA